ncbi:MAG: hypothetical protein CM15mV81_300 [uncultured marine virus]|nr:MAG: hypothetical protein CM15mV81_300 [uncultured marine virus]
MDIGKSLAHIEWYFEGGGVNGNPHDLQYDVDADPAGKKTHVQKKRIGDDEYIESDEMVPIGQYGFKDYFQSIYGTQPLWIIIMP